MNALANVYAAQGKYAQAETLDNQTLEIRRRVLGPDIPTRWPPCTIWPLTTKCRASTRRQRRSIDAPWRSDLAFWVPSIPTH